MKKIQKIDVIIIGGGIAGISAANHLKKNNIDYLIIEKESNLGGLLRPLKYNNFSFDRAVHLSFAEEKEVRAEFDRTDYITHKPNAYNWDQNLWIRHPVQNNLYPLDLEKKVKAIKSLIQSSEYSDEVKNYEDWLYCSYGKYFSDHYPSKYTKKYWRYDAKELDIDWLGPRMPSVDIELVLEGAMSEAERNTYYVKEMRYPKKGAYYEFIKDLASGVNALCEEQVISVNLEEQYILIRSGNKIHYSYIINTSPLPDLVKIISKVPNKIMMYAQDLEATSVDLISIGMKSSIKFKSLWFYIYDEDIYASRCYSPSIKSTENAPIGHSSIQFEIYSVSDESKPSVDEMKNNCIYALKKMKICNEEDILFIEHHNEENANVIFKKGTSLNASSIVKWLKLRKVFQLVDLVNGNTYG